MTYTISRDGQNLGTYSEEGLVRQLNNGAILPTDLVFLETEQRWVAIRDLPKSEREVVAEFRQQLVVGTTPFVTLGLIAINVLVFLLMLFSGVSVSDPKSADLLRWGADFGPLTTHGQWWRLLTAAFVHIGLLHIALNMWTFYQSGMFTERLFGNFRFLTLYLAAAIGGNLASVAWHPMTVAAGASGAVFGVYGGLISLLLVNRESIPKSTAKALARSALIFVGYNILYGLGNSAIDMAAHIGGLITGVIVGCALLYRLGPSDGRAGLQRGMAVAMVSLLVFAGIGSRLGKGDSGQADAFAAELNGKSLTVGKSDIIVYSGSVTDSDAKRLGEALTSIGFLRDHGAMLFYSRGQSGSVVSLIVKESAWQDPTSATAFNFLGKRIADATSTPLKLRLLNRAREMKKEFVF